MSYVEGEWTDGGGYEPDIDFRDTLMGTSGQDRNLKEFKIKTSVREEDTSFYKCSTFYRSPFHRWKHKKFFFFFTHFYNGSLKILKWKKYFKIYRWLVVCFLMRILCLFMEVWILLKFSCCIVVFVAFELFYCKH